MLHPMLYAMQFVYSECGNSLTYIKRVHVDGMLYIRKYL